MARAISHLRKRDSATGKSNLFHVNEEWSMCRTSGNTEGKNSHGTVNKSHAWLERLQRWCSVHSEWFMFLKSKWQPDLLGPPTLSCNPTDVAPAQGPTEMPACQRRLPAEWAPGSDHWTVRDSFYGLLAFLPSFSLCSPHLTLPWHHNCTLGPPVH